MPPSPSTPAVLERETVPDQLNSWNLLLNAIEKRINHESFTTWFKPLIYLGTENDAIKLVAPDQVFEDWILNNYRDVVEESLQASKGPRFGGVDSAARRSPSSHWQRSPGPAPMGRMAMRRNPGRQLWRASRRARLRLRGPGLSGFGEMERLDLTPIRYTFDTFVVGSCNQFAHAAALAIAGALRLTTRYSSMVVWAGQDSPHIARSAI